MAQNKKTLTPAQWVILIAALCTAAVTIGGYVGDVYGKVLWVKQGIVLAHKMHANKESATEYKKRIIILDQRIDSMKKHSLTQERVEIYLKTLNKIMIGELDVMYHRNIRLYITNDSVPYYYKEGWIFPARHMLREDIYWYKNYFTNQTHECE